MHFYLAVEAAVLVREVADVVAAVVADAVGEEAEQ